MLNPFRKFAQSAKKSFGYCLSPGMTVLEVGPGMGFFSLDTARLIGPKGRLVCVDVQPRMIEALRRRAENAGLSERIDARVCEKSSLGVDDLKGRVDLALVLFTAHEISDRPRFFSQVRATLAPQGRLFLAEPKLHVKQHLFDEIEGAALGAGFSLIEHPRMFRSRASLMAAC